jgi:hypothetical protein
MADDRHEIDQLVGSDMRLELQPGERQQVVDQTAHAVRLVQHDGEEALLRLGVGAGRPLHGLDEAAQGGERRAQLVAGIGDEIAAHPVDAAQFGYVLERQQEQVLPRAFYMERRDADDIDPLGGKPLGMLDLVRLVGGDGLAHHVEDARRAEARRNMKAGLERAEGLFRRAVLLAQDSVATKDEDRQLDGAEDGGDHRTGRVDLFHWRRRRCGLGSDDRLVRAIAQQDGDDREAEENGGKSRLRPGEIGRERDKCGGDEIGPARRGTPHQNSPAKGISAQEASAFMFRARSSNCPHSVDS